MIKERFELTASSLGAYFGVGFNAPEDQILYDLGLKENVFTKDAEDRMELGKMLEDAALNYAEYKLGIQIFNRNIDVVTAFDGKLRCKLDGECIIDGLPTVVENKVSNAAGKRFTEDLGYFLQCQAYMEQTGYSQALLCGLYNGKFIWKIIRRDEKVIQQMREVVEFVWEVLNGISDMADFPYHITDDFAGRMSLEEVPVEELTPDDVDFMDELFNLKNDFEYKRIDERIKSITDYLKGKFKNQKVDGGAYTCSISTVTRKGDIDMDALKDAHPEIDFDAFRKPDSEYAKVDIRAKKAGKKIP